MQPVAPDQPEAAGADKSSGLVKQLLMRGFAELVPSGDFHPSSSEGIPAFGRGGSVREYQRAA
ncbi:hypothetical protein GCM10018966_003380 [Streptomyces yanii]